MLLVLVSQIEAEWMLYSLQECNKFVTKECIESSWLLIFCEKKLHRMTQRGDGFVEELMNVP